MTWWQFFLRSLWRYSPPYDEQRWIRMRLHELRERVVIVQDFSIDPRGEWSECQMRRVRQALNDEASAKQLPIAFRAINISTFNKPERYLIHVYCTRHQQQIEYGSACALCLREEKRRR